MRALVLGAAGFLGINLVDALLAAGITPRCGRRRRTNVLALRKRPAPMVLADIDQPETLIEAMRDCDVVFHLAGHYPRLCVDRQATLRTGLTQTEVVLDAAAASGVRRVVYASSTATVARAAVGASTEQDVFAAAPGYGVYHDLKWTMERRVLAETRVETLVACPGACLGPWDLRVGTSALIVALARGLNPPHPDGIVNLVDARDVGVALTRYAQLESAPRRLLMVGSNHRLQPLLESLAARYGVAPPQSPLPLERAKTLADEAEHAASLAGGRSEMSREIVDLIGHGVPIDAGTAMGALPMQWTPLAETLDAFDAWARRLRILPDTPTPEPV